MHYCVVCDLDLSIHKSVNIYKCILPQSSAVLISVIQRLTRINLTDKKNNHLCIECFDLFNQFDLAEYTYNHSRKQIIERLKEKNGIDLQFIDVACQTEDLLNDIKNDVIDDGIKTEIEDSFTLKKEQNQNYFSDLNENDDDRLSVTVEYSNSEQSKEVCEYCNTEFAKSSEFIRHVKKCMKRKKLPLSCNQCKKHYTSKAGLRWHLKHKHNIQDVEETVPEPSDIVECNIKIENTECQDQDIFNIEESIDEQEPAENISSSDESKTDKTTEKSKKRRGGRPKNTTGIYVTPAKYKCPQCPKKYRTKSQLRNHILSHTDMKHFCDVCGKAYKYESALEIHVGMHRGIIPFKCDVCNKPFSQRGALNQHLLIHKGEPLCQCDLCGKQFIHSSSLKVHLRAHQGLKPYKCEICDLRFFTGSHVKRHMRTHSGEKSYACSQCGKRFAERYNLVSHERLHNSPSTPRKRTHTCPLCGASFYRKQKLEEHLANNHNKVTDDS